MGGRADGKVGETIAVDIAGGGDGVAVKGFGLVAKAAPGGGGNEPRWRAAKDEGGAFGELVVAEVGGADDDVGKGVVADVAERGDGVTELGAGHVTGEDLVGGGVEAGRGAEKDPDGAGIFEEAVVVEGSADDDIREAVAVEIADSSDGGAQAYAGLIGDKGPAGGGVEAGGGAIEEEGGAGGRQAVRVLGGADEDVVVAVAVDVAGGGDGVTKGGAGPAAEEDEVGRR